MALNDTEPVPHDKRSCPRPPHINVNSTTDATFLSCTFPPINSSSSSSIGSVSSFFVTAIPHPQNPNVFINYWTPWGDNNTYIYTHLAVNPIGSSKNTKKSIMVYRAVMFTTVVDRYSICTYRRNKDIFYALKVVDDYNPKSISKLREQVRRMYAMKETSHDNLLKISSSFVDEQSNKLCVVVDEHVPGSIRTIIKNRSPQGITEDLILSVLRSVLKALKFLHAQQITHTDINAGHIYLCDTSIFTTNHFVIKLGFAASIYEDDDDDENTSYLPMASMSKWAAAPEVYYGTQSDYSEKADIWLVGITALELAYGGLKVSNRNSLEAMIKNISLPPVGVMFKSYVKKLLSPYVNVDDEDELVWPLLSSNSEDYCPLFPKFSRSFIEMVMQCLTWDPKKRPSVHRLLYQPFFTNNLSRKDGRYFYDALMNKTSASS